MNTGNGKTLVGLMLLKSALNEHAGPAAYLTPDPVYLVDQVEAAAGDLGLGTSRDPRDPAVASGSAILLATVKTLFNGRSKFGVAPEGRKIKLGTVLIDDAHACLATVEEQFEIRLPATHPAYGQLAHPVRAVAAAAAARALPHQEDVPASATSPLNNGLQRVVLFLRRAGGCAGRGCGTQRLDPAAARPAAGEVMTAAARYVPRDTAAASAAR